MTAESRRWTLYICDKCHRPGYIFQGSRPCSYGGRHHGKHGGPLEVIPAADFDGFKERLLASEDVLNEVARLDYMRLASQPFGGWEKVPEKYKVGFREQAQETLRAATSVAEQETD